MNKQCTSRLGQSWRDRLRHEQRRCVPTSVVPMFAGTSEPLTGVRQATRMSPPCWATQMRERGLALLPCASSSQPEHPRDALHRNAAKAWSWGMMVCGAGEDPAMQPFPPHQSPSQQPERVSLVIKNTFYCHTSCPKAGLADGPVLHVEEAAARRQLNACPVLRVGILDFTVTLHSLKIIDLNALLIKQSSQIYVLGRNTQLQALL